MIPGPGANGPARSRLRTQSSITAQAPGQDQIVDVKRLVKILKAGGARACAKQFWEAIKSLAVHHFSSTEAAFTKYASPVDRLMDASQFQELCDSFGIHVSPSMLKTLFDSKLRGEDLAMSLQDFQNACIVAQIDRIRDRVQEHNRTLRRVAGHIDAFIQCLVLQADDQGRRNAITRFQRKLDLQFCKNLWTRLQIWAFRMTASKGLTRDTTSIDCRTFLNLVERTASFQAYEIDFVEHIFERVDRSRRGLVRMIDLVVTLIQMSPGSSRRHRGAFLFTLFDTDSDGCLSAEQLLKLYCRDRKSVV